MNAMKKKLILIAVLGFCVCTLIDWTGIIDNRRFPKSWSEAWIQVFINILWTALFTGISYFAIIRRPR